jgi:hypothetical protein
VNLLATLCFFFKGSVQNVILRGKTREEIEQKLVHKTREELIDMIHSLVSLEIHYRPSEIAQRTGLNKRRILRAIKEGNLTPYLALADNALRVPISAVNTWLGRYRVFRKGQRRPS